MIREIYLFIEIFYSIAIYSVYFQVKRAYKEIPIKRFKLAKDFLIISLFFAIFNALSFLTFHFFVFSGERYDAMIDYLSRPEINGNLFYYPSFYVGQTINIFSYIISSLFLVLAFKYLFNVSLIKDKIEGLPVIIWMTIAWCLVFIFLYKVPIPVRFLFSLYPFSFILIFFSSLAIYEWIRRVSYATYVVKIIEVSFIFLLSGIVFSILLINSYTNMFSWEYPVFKLLKTIFLHIGMLILAAALVLYSILIRKREEVKIKGKINRAYISLVKAMNEVLGRAYKGILSLSFAEFQEKFNKEISYDEKMIPKNLNKDEFINLIAIIYEKLKDILSKDGRRALLRLIYLSDRQGYLEIRKIINSFELDEIKKFEKKFLKFKK